MTSPRRQTGLLASVANLAEARMALAGGADIIDLKNPAAGALGALDCTEVQRIVQALSGQKPVSATVGDLPMQPQSLLAAVQAMGDTGVDYVKIGFFPGGDWQACLTALQPLTQRLRLIAVLFADQPPVLDGKMAYSSPSDASGKVLNAMPTPNSSGFRPPLPSGEDWGEGEVKRPQPFAFMPGIAAAGFSGAMLDTMDKTRGSLRQVLPKTRLSEFVTLAHEHGLLCGLAGSLGTEDIAPLLVLQPDYLGFRSALCVASRRTAGLSQTALETVRGLIPA